MTDDTEDDKSKTIVEKTSETIEKTNATLENAGNLIGTIKWVAIAFVALVILIISYTLYRTLSAPVRAVGSAAEGVSDVVSSCLLYTSPSPRDATLSRMPSSA